MIASDERLDAAFWSRHLLADAKPSAAALEALEQAQCEVLLDLAGGEESRHSVALLSDAHAGKNVLRALSAVFACGIDVEWSALYGDRPRRKLSLPTYPFERERHWLDFPERASSGRSSTTAPPSDRLTERPITHPFGGKLRSSRPAPPGSGVVSRAGDENKVKKA